METVCVKGCGNLKDLTPLRGMKSLARVRISPDQRGMVEEQLAGLGLEIVVEND